MTPTTSIALCTYNGERFLPSQLESLLRQTQLPNELVVCDDNSTDSTVKILEKFAHKAPFKVQIFVNDTPIGVVKNFENAAKLCQNEIVFFCDQDDLWMPTKIEKQAKFLTQNPDIQVVFSNLDLVDELLNPLRKTMWEEVRFRKKQQQRWKSGKAIEVLLQGNRVSGCSMAIRKTFLEKVLPFPTQPAGFIHDAYLALAAAMTGQISFLEESLVFYRQHQTQQIGTRPKEKPEEVAIHQRFQREREEKLAPLREQAHYWQQVFEQVKHLTLTDDPHTQSIKQFISFLHMRSTLPKLQLLRLVPIVRHFWNGNYTRFKDQDANWYAGYLAALGDLIE